MVRQGSSCLVTTFCDAIHTCDEKFKLTTELFSQTAAQNMDAVWIEVDDKTADQRRQ